MYIGTTDERLLQPVEHTLFPSPPYKLFKERLVVERSLHMVGLFNVDISFFLKDKGDQKEQEQLTFALTPFPSSSSTPTLALIPALTQSSQALLSSSSDIWRISIFRCNLRAPKSGAYTSPGEEGEKIVGADDKSVGSTCNGISTERKKKEKTKRTNHPSPPLTRTPIQPPFKSRPLPLPKLKFVTRAFVSVIHDR